MGHVFSYLFQAGSDSLDVLLKNILFLLKPYANSRFINRISLKPKFTANKMAIVKESLEIQRIQATENISIR